MSKYDAREVYTSAYSFLREIEAANKALRIDSLPDAVREHLLKREESLRKHIVSNHERMHPRAVKAARISRYYAMIEAEDSY